MAASVFSKIKAFRCANQHSRVGGVCAGIAYQLRIPPWILRVLVFLALFTSFFPGRIGGYVFAIYCLLWYFVPEYTKDPDDFNQVTGG